MRCASRTYAHMRCEEQQPSDAVEGVDMSRLVRNSGVCVRIIVGDLANVTHDFPRPGSREGDATRGAMSVGGKEGGSGERRQQPRLIKTADGN